MHLVRSVARWLFRFMVLWFVDALSIMVTAQLLPSVNLEPTNGSIWITAAAAAFMLGIVNLLIRPIILLLALPFGVIPVLVFGFLANAIAILITSNLLPALQVADFGAAFIAGLIMAVVNTIVISIISIDDDDSFFQGLVERLARRRQDATASDGSRGLVMLEIDGLSYYHMKEALESGLMPNAKKLMDEQGYALSRVDCGIPSQTSACQAGILFGDSYDIPAFRWYDKEQGRALVSSKDASEINARYAKGNGLLRGGTSINNMMNGDAAVSLLTLATLRSGTPEEKKRRAQDIYLLMINPYFIMRTIVLLIGEALVEVWEYWHDKRNNVQPILNRLHGGYPVMRAATTTFMRDVAEYLVSLNIVRGAPAMYTTWPGYDEVAHHTGPSTKAAFRVLSNYDKTIGRVADLIERKGPRPYDLIVLSDHGQAFGPTFKQRYGYSLKEFIEKHLPSGATVQQSTGGDDGTIALTAVSGELQNMSEQGVGGKTAGTVAKSGQKALDAGSKRRQNDNAPASDGGAPPTVTVFGSGNLAPVYFHFSRNRITRPELDATYPGLFSGLLEHEGVGVILAYEADGTPMVWGKRGKFDLSSNKIEGENPLKMYGDPVVRAEQLRRLAGFPHNGDLTVFSTVYSDGTVAAMEELIGSHGGMGGVQTDAFLFHPGDMPVRETTNSVDVFQILDARRREPVAPKPAAPKSTEYDDWAPKRLGSGIAQVKEWLPLALRAILLNPGAYRQVVRNPLMTGPALLIGILAPIIAGIVSRGGFDLQLTVQGLLRWLLATVVVFGAGRLLRPRGGGATPGHRATYTEVFRGLGFAQGTWLISLLTLIPVLSSFAGALTTIVAIVVAWVAAVVAHDLRGWRAIAFPLVIILVFAFAVVVTVILLSGAAVSLSTLAQGLGLAR